MANIECTEAGAEAYVLFDSASIGDDRFAVEPLRDEITFAPPIGVDGLDLKQQQEFHHFH